METKEKLKKILMEWREFEFPPSYPRDFDTSLLKGSEILSVIGARRAGKTYLCYQMIQELRASLPADNLMYINLEDERLYPLRGDELSLLWETYLELFSVELRQRVYIFVDEIQNIPGWSKWARRLTEQNKNVKLVITGSSSKLLSQEIATELRGRTLSFNVYPLSFKEYLKARGIHWENKNLLYSKTRIVIKKHFYEYFKLGGFPALLQASRPQELLKEYYKVMFYRDLIDRYGIKNTKLFEDFLTLLIDQMSTTFSISSTAKKLNQFGYSFSKNTLSNFLHYAEEIFLVFQTKVYSYKLKEQLRNPKKIYCIDHGLAQAIRFAFSEDLGRILENIVYVHLRRKYENIYYFQENKECDFLIVQGPHVTQAIQVTKSLFLEKTRQREIEGLKEALLKFKLKEGVILTEDESETLKLKNLTIKIMPLWYWLLLSLDS